MVAVAHESLTGCPACGEAARETLFTKDGWPVARCAACSLVYVDAHLDRAALDAIYGRDYFEGDAFADYLGERDDRLIGARDRARLLADVVPGGRLLDIGCAAGFFLEAASQPMRSPASRSPNTRRSTRARVRPSRVHRRARGRRARRR